MDAVYRAGAFTRPAAERCIPSPYLICELCIRRLDYISTRALWWPWPMQSFLSQLCFSTQLNSRIQFANIIIMASFFLVLQGGCSGNQIWSHNNFT